MDGAYRTDASRVALSGARAKLMFPRAGLRGLIALAVVRDTRGAALTNAERFSFFPASPFCAISYVLEGELYLVGPTQRNLPARMASRFLSGPSRGPVTSWSPGPVLTMSICLFPNAWSAVSGLDPRQTIDVYSPLEGCLSPDLARQFDEAAQAGDCEGVFARTEDALEPRWRENRAGGFSPPWLTDWLRGLAIQAAFSGPGKSARQIQRRIKTWTGKTQRDWQTHARLEQAFARGVNATQGSIAELAVDAGYSDQSHMGREIKRLTGYSPARLMKLINSDERFWFYSLMGEVY